MQEETTEELLQQAREQITSECGHWRPTRRGYWNLRVSDQQPSLTCESKCKCRKADIEWLWKHKVDISKGGENGYEGISFCRCKMPIAIQTNQDLSGQRDLSGEQTGQDTSDTSGQDGGQDNSGQAMLVDNNTPSDPLIED